LVTITIAPGATDAGTVYLKSLMVMAAGAADEAGDAADEAEEVAELGELGPAEDIGGVEAADALAEDVAARAAPAQTRTIVARRGDDCVMVAPKGPAGLGKGGTGTACTWAWRGGNHDGEDEQVGRDDEQVDGERRGIPHAATTAVVLGG
jgi:hypothetical protein